MLEFSLELRKDGLSRTVRVGLSGGYSSVGVSYFSFLWHNQAGSGDPPILEWVSGFIPGDSAAGGVTTTRLNGVAKLRMSGCIPLLPLYASLAWAGSS
jgi:hypothetical protein